MSLVHLSQPNTPQSDWEAILAFGTATMRPGEVHEARAPKTRGEVRGIYGVGSGYFSSPEALADALARYDGFAAEGFYLTINPVDPDLLARANDRMVFGRPVTTTDADIVRRGHLLIDIDPVRKSGISATDGERDLAWETATWLRAVLSDALGWPPPVAMLMTGNGSALLYRVSIANDDPAMQLVSRVLQGVASLVIDERISIDQTVRNAARIGKIAGTVAAKGDPTETRPWRLATAILAPDTMPVPVSALEMVAELAPVAPRPGTTPAWSAGDGTIADRLPGLLDAAGVGYTVKAQGWGTTYALDRCLTSSDHADGAALHTFPSGAVGYRCHHNRCQGKGWHDAKVALGLGEITPSPSPRMTFHVAGVAAEALPETLPAPRSTGSGKVLADSSLAAAFEPVPAICHYGWFGDYVRLMAPTTEAPDAFHLASSFGLAGAIVGRSITVPAIGELVAPNLYICLIGESGKSRKDTAIKRAMHLANQAGESTTFYLPPFQRAYDISSSQGMAKKMSEGGPNVLLNLSELSLLVANMNRESTRSIRDWLIAVWDNPDTLENNTKKDPNMVRNACLSILAGIQPDRAAEEMTHKDIVSGFANRWLWVPGKGKGRNARPVMPDPALTWQLYTQFFDAAKRLGKTRLSFAPETDALWDAWYEQHQDRIDAADPQIRPMLQRQQNNIVKIAMLYAISDNSHEILARHLEPAIAFLNWSWEQTRALFAEWGVTLEERVAEAIIRLIKRHGSGTLRRSDIQRGTRTRGLDAVKFGRLFEAMRNNGTIVEDAERRWWVEEDVPSGGFQ